MGYRELVQLQMASFHATAGETNEGVSGGNAAARCMDMESLIQVRDQAERSFSWYMRRSSVSFFSLAASASSARLRSVMSL